VRMNTAPLHPQSCLTPVSNRMRRLSHRIRPQPEAIAPPHHPGDSSLSRISLRRSTRPRPASTRSLRPKVDRLESRELLSTTPLVAHPMFEVGPLVANPNPPSGAFTPAQVQQAYRFNKIAFNGVTGDGTGQTIAIVDAYD